MDRWLSAWRNGCNGLIDEVRISKSIRTIDTTPEQPLAGYRTVGLWHFDALDNQGHSPDDSSFKNDAAIDAESVGRYRWPSPQSQKTILVARWWDSIGRRPISRTIVGTKRTSAHFLAASFPSATGPVLKGLAIRPPAESHDEAAVCYDTGQLSFRAAGAASSGLRSLPDLA